MFDISYTQEFDNNSNYFCDDEKSDLLNISFDSNISIEQINFKSDVFQNECIETPIKKQSTEKCIDLQTSRSLEQPSTEKFNISLDLDYSIELLNANEDESAQKSGKRIL